jgi:hypothetical protein
MKRENCCECRVQDGIFIFCSLHEAAEDLYDAVKFAARKIEAMPGLLDVKFALAEAISKAEEGMQ